MVLLETYYNDIKRVRALYPLARFISVSRELPHKKDGTPYNLCEERDIILVPSRKLARAYKNGEITWPEYKLLFNDELSTDEAQGSMWIIAQRAVKQDICLVCFEGPKEEERCHRFLLLDKISHIAKNNGLYLQVEKTGNFQTHKNRMQKQSVPQLFDF